MRKIIAGLMVLLPMAILMTGRGVLTGIAAAQESAQSGTIVVIGTAPVEGDKVSDAREKAIADSLATAVALKTEALLQVESFVENFSQISELLFEQTSAFVESYKVLTEAQRDKSYHVVVQANVSGDKISKYLKEAGILRVKTELPRVLFMVAEQKLGEPYPGFWWGPAGAYFESLSVAVMAAQMKEAGFTMIDHKQARRNQQLNWKAFDKADLSDQEAAELGVLLKADVIVAGKATVNPATNIMGSGMRSFNGSISVRVIRTNTAAAFLNLSRTAVAVSEDDISGGRSALEDVGALAGKALAEELTVAWQKQAGKPSEISMVIRGTEHLASYVKFRKAMNAISGVEGIRVKGIKPNEATLLVEYKGKTKDLAAALMQQNFGTFGINIFEVSEQAVRVELIPQ